MLVVEGDGDTTQGAALQLGQACSFTPAPISLAEGFA